MQKPKMDNLKKNKSILKIKQRVLHFELELTKTTKLEVVEKKKLFGGFSYTLGWQEFNSRGVAEAELAKILAEHAARRAERDNAKAELEKIETEIAKLEQTTFTS